MNEIDWTASTNWSDLHWRTGLKPTELLAMMACDRFPRPTYPKSIPSPIADKRAIADFLSFAYWSIAEVDKHMRGHLHLVR